MSLGSAEPPWKMWGSTQVITVPAAFTTAPVAVPQIAQVNYRRPETWSFFLAAKLESFEAQGLDLTVFCDFELLLGVGRSLFDTSPPYIGGIPTSAPFARFGWIVPAGQPPAADAGSVKFCTSVVSPPLDETLATPVGTLIDHFVAESITSKATIRTSSLTAPLTISVSTFFAPRTHVRPDWFGNSDEEARRFRGDEQGGT